jgi:hypothetical protein
MTVPHEYRDSADECIRLAGLTDDLEVRDKLVELACRFMANARDERYKQSDNVVPLRAGRRNYADNGASTG